MTTAGQFRDHAVHLETLRARLGRIRCAAGWIGTDQSAFGALCGWVLTAMGDRYLRQDELMGELEVNLTCFVDGLRRVADGEHRLADLIGMPDEHTYPVHRDGEGRTAGIMDDVRTAIDSREWVEPRLHEAAPVAEFAVLVDGRAAALRAGGLECAVFCVEPLRRMLDDLAGAPDVVAVQVIRWNRLSADLARIGADLQSCLDADFPGPNRTDVNAYLVMNGNNVDALIGLGAIAGCMALITRSAGDLILLTRDIVRGLLGDVFARVIAWVTDPGGVIARPLLVAQLAGVVATAWRIQAYLDDLVTSTANLSECLEG